MSNKRKLKPPVGLDRYGQNYMDRKKRIKLGIQLQQEHNRQGNARAREIAKQSESIAARMASGELTPTEAQAELLDTVATSRKR